MPVVFIEAPPGIQDEAKKKLIERITSAIDDAYHIEACSPRDQRPGSHDTA